MPPSIQDKLYQGLREFARSRRLIRPGDKIVVAASGGLDSVVLLDLLYRLREEWQLHLVVAHFNHQLRGRESDADEAFVKSLATPLNLDFHAGRSDVGAESKARKRSIQEVARDLRYGFLDGLRRELKCDSIATAHQADDNAETMLFNFIRGTGVRGLSGIPASREDLHVIRPLLFATRAEIAEYAAARGLAHVEDSSNKKTDYARNFLRLKVMPLLREQVNPGLDATLRRTRDLYEELGRYVAGESEKILKVIVTSRTAEEIVIDLPSFRHQPLFMQEELLWRLCKEFTSSDIENETVASMLAVCEMESGGSCTLPAGAVLCRDRDRLLFRRTKAQSTYCHKIELDRPYDFTAFSFRSARVPKANFSDDPNIEYVDANSLGRDIVLRSWRDGDWFIPLGMKDRKKLSDFFVDQKVPAFEKRSIPILTSDEEIVWICGMRLDDRHKVTGSTAHILRLEYSPRPQPS